MSHSEGVLMPDPISPADVVAHKTETIPEVVFEVVNALIAQNWNGTSARVLQGDVVGEILERMPSFTREEIFALGYLNFEESYRAAGWLVVYDKPGYYQTYQAYFMFRRKT